MWLTDWAVLNCCLQLPTQMFKEWVGRSGFFFFFYSG